MENKMFCYQCQETANCTGCTLTGVCGKNPQVAAAQDLLVYVTKGYCEVTTRLRKEGTNISDAENRMVVMNLFMTITNANFDKEAIANRIHDTLHVKKELLKKVNFLKLGGYLVKKGIATAGSLITGNPLPLILSIGEDVSKINVDSVVTTLEQIKEGTM